VFPHKQIESRLRQAVAAVLPDADLATVQVRPCPEERFGDYQTAALIALAKARKVNPRQLAADVLARLDLRDLCGRVEIAGAGFLNFQLARAAVGDTLAAAARGGRLFFEPASQPRTVIVDFSSPNVAKQMHVGHIRSTILGDGLARLLRLLGHRVITDNHLGDWGTQFGMLIVGWKIESFMGEVLAKHPDPISELERIYKLVHAAGTGDQKALAYINERLKFGAKLEVKSVSADGAMSWVREELVKLQQGVWPNTQIWNELLCISTRQFEEIYSRLGVRFDYMLGESFYNPRLGPLVDELVAKGIARESEGALVIFFDALPALKAHPALVRKSDGGFNYTTTDLATLAHRQETWQPDEIIYVTDGRQQLHFQQLFAAFRRWRPGAAFKPVHVWFGSILGEDDKPFKTRSGETVKLTDLLDEAQERALNIVTAKNPALSEAERREIARVVGLGAVKYADLLPNRQSDYVFSWDKMLALHGNTAPYLQYAYARIRSIFRKGAIEASAIGAQLPVLSLAAPEEIALAKHLLNFGLTLEGAAEEYRLNFICNYLYELAGRFTAFYENCPVLKAGPEERACRLALCDLTARVLKQGLDVLGIEVLEQM